MIVFLITLLAGTEGIGMANFWQFDAGIRVHKRFPFSLALVLIAASAAAQSSPKPSAQQSPSRNQRKENPPQRRQTHSRRSHQVFWSS